MTDQIPDEVRDELEELRTRDQLHEAELAGLRPLAVRQRIADAGFDPDGPGGKVLAELAAHDADLAGSAKQMARKAAQLGLTGDGSTPPAEPTAEPSNLTDPRYGPDHPRNIAGTSANRLARVEAEKATKAQAVLDQMQSADAQGALEDEPEHPMAGHLAQKASQDPTPRATPPVGPPGYDDAQRREYREKSQAAIAQMLGVAPAED